MRSFMAVVLLVAGLVLPGAPARAAEFSFLNLSFNLCGNKCNGGRLAVADSTADAILDRPTRPRTATLQEVCAGQAQRLRTRLGAAGYKVIHVPTAHRCDDGSDYGIALVHRGEAAWHRVHPLPNPGGHEPRKAVCAMLRTPATLACSTHIDFHADGTRGAQIREIATLIADFTAAGHATYIGGDFNAEPTDDQLDPLYLPAYGGGATGRLTEATGCCTRGGPATADGGRKIDYTFALAGKFNPDWIDVVPTDQSDHHKVWSRFTLR
ncbi:endonuclease/exonuclease/phosphatase family protein [Actinokineospora spheciospongiae]|uniref:endonuclease/exonuclease/phosphatase family protein n=1 Tax=Actinokineospora spheciospongiae TaxID=909613 RepID=UPI000D70A22E|nr:endonuclease/exonuclease/phosphatase family protein [Actinokineospora spheciospongiae]PWW66530.1 endonuclease/exonuclease/phosphatase (EEP) superfamily protein YafD [Actinokineospora spheciospongiae]